VGVYHPFILLPTYKAYPIATLLHAHCAIYTPPPNPPLYAIHHTILVIAISCKDQVQLRATPQPPQTHDFRSRFFYYSFYFLSRGMWCLRHARALAWRRGPVWVCTRVYWCRRICTYIIHTYTYFLSRAVRSPVSNRTFVAAKSTVGSGAIMTP